MNSDFLNRFTLNTSLVDSLDFNPYYKEISSALGERILINGEEFINLATNNYLGLADNIDVINASHKALDTYGLSMCSTPVAGGACKIYNEAVSALSVFCGLEDCVIFPSCYQANNALFNVIAGKNDIILIDHFAHSSLAEGAKSSKASIRPFLHNNIRNLEEIIEKIKVKYEQIFVVTESVFSTEGTIAPLQEINDLCKKHNAIFIVDDSHGVGVLGNNGKGAVSCIENFNGIYTASLGKALAASGGVIGGNRIIVNFLRYYCSHLVYSTAIIPAALGGVIEAINVLNKRHSEIQSQIVKNKKHLLFSLKESGFDCDNSDAPIISIKSGNSAETIILSKKFYDSKLLVTPFIFPSVPEKGGRIRIIAGANLSDDIISEACKRIRELK